VDGLIADITSPAAINVVNSMLGLCNRMVDAIGSCFAGVVVIPPERIEEIGYRDQLVFGELGQTPAYGFINDQEMFDFSNCVEYLEQHEMLETGISLSGIIQALQGAAYIAVSRERRDRGQRLLKSDFYSELVRYNVYSIYQQLLRALPESPKPKLEMQRLSAVKVLKDLSSYVISDLYGWFASMGEMAQNCTVYSSVCMDLGEKALAAAFSELPGERTKEGSHTVHALGLLSQAAMILVKEKGEKDPVLAQCSILVTCASFWAGVMPVDSALLECGKAERILEESDLQSEILQSELYRKYRSEMNKRVTETMK
jgi:hypothetical protein